MAIVMMAVSAASALGLPLVALDPGHGGADSGAVGPLPPGTVTALPPRADVLGNPLLFEKDVNLDVAQRLNGFLQGHGFSTVMTRNTDNAAGDVPYTTQGVDLKARTDIANAQAANLFVSIHQNSVKKIGLWWLVSGTETYVHPTATAVSRAVALAVQQALVARLLLPDRTVKDKNFFVLRNSLMPAILVEGAFVSNPTIDAVQLANPDIRQAMAEGIGTGIINAAPLLGDGVGAPPAAPVPTAIKLARSGRSVTARAGINPKRGDLWVATVTDGAGAPIAGIPLTARLPNGKGVRVSTRFDGKALLAVPRRRGLLAVAVALPGIKVHTRGNVPARIA